jgi:hypothetical protein
MNATLQFQYTNMATYKTVPELKILDLSDDILAAIVKQLGKEHTIDGAIIPHPETLPYGPREKYALPPANSKDVPPFDLTYISYGGIWRSAIARTDKRFGAITKQVCASAWCKKMTKQLAMNRVLHAMRNPSFASPTLMREWYEEFMPTSIRHILSKEGLPSYAMLRLKWTFRESTVLSRWVELVESDTYLSIMKRAASGKVVEILKIEVFARLLLYCRDLDPSRWASRINEFEQTPSGSTLLLAIVHQLFLLYRSESVSHRGAFVKYLHPHMCSILKEITLGVKVSLEQTLVTLERIHWGANLLADLEALGNLNGIMYSAL